MYAFIRLGLVVVKALKAASRAPITDLTAEVRTPLRVWPQDLDGNLHLNNGRYLTLGDLGRFDLVARAGLLVTLYKRGWLPVLASATVRFRRSLGPLQKFHLTTRIVYWDEKWFYIEHRYEREEQVYATALVKAVFKHGSVTVPMAKVFALLPAEASAKAATTPPEEWKAVIAAWATLEEAQRRTAKAVPTES